MFVNIKKVLLSPYTETPPVDFFDWDPNGVTRIHLLDKETGEKVPIVYEARAFAVFHHINAYEEDGQVNIWHVIFFIIFTYLYYCIRKMDTYL